MNELLITKKNRLERCLAQIRGYLTLERELPFEQDYLVQDAVTINIQRACETAIDMANIVIKARALGVPESSRESFETLEKEGVISAELSAKMRNMVGFRNVLVHRYQDLDKDILKTVATTGVEDLEAFAQVLQDKA